MTPPPDTAPRTQATLYLVPNTLDHGLVDRSSPLTDTLALQVLQVAARLDHWVVENAKSARAFLKRVDAVVPLAHPLQALNIAELPRPQKGSHATIPVDWRPLLEPLHTGHDVGVLSEAGMPAVADPGAGLVAAAHQAGLRVEPLVGPSALLLAVAASGLNGQSFAFVGYLPVESSARVTRLRELEAHSKRQGQTQMVIETPYRNQALFEALLTTLSPSTRLAIGCGLTTAEGWNRTKTVATWAQQRPALPSDVPAVFSFHA